MRTVHDSSSICVFCGSRVGRHERYRSLARAVGEGLAQRGATLIYGGGQVGLMGDVSDAAFDAGGKVVGIIPVFLRHVERVNTRMTRRIVTDSMFARKQAMFDLSDGFLALPGGIGTLDEIMEVMTWQHLDQLAPGSNKPIVLLDEGDFWAPFKTLLDHYVSEGFVGEAVFDLVSFSGSIKEAFSALGIGDTPSTDG
jgi:uncharacterized protein (TIGR00730 family)